MCLLIIFLIIEVSNLDVRIFAILNGGVYVMQHLLNAASSATTVCEKQRFRELHGASMDVVPPFAKRTVTSPHWTHPVAQS